jgi:WD40-like Beta Propeller Repeat
MENHAMLANKIRKVLSMICVTLFVIPVVLAQNHELKGFVFAALTGPTVDDTTIEFIDLGTGAMWNKDIGAEGYTYYEWMPDGCHVLLTRPGDDGMGLRMFALSVTDLSISEIALQGAPMWSPNGENLAYFVDRDGISTLYYIEQFDNTELSKPIPIATFHGWYRRDGAGWVTEDVLMYETGTARFLWNRVDKSTQELPFPVYPLIPKFHNVSRSPDRTTLAVFASLSEYRNAVDPRITNLTPTEIEEAEKNKPSDTGLDLYNLSEVNSRIHVNVKNEFLFDVIWSPDSEKLVVVTEPKSNDFGIFIYDRSSLLLRRIADAYIREARYYEPTWSSDSQWLSYRSPDGYFVENIQTRDKIKVPINIDTSSLFWSPIMSYSGIECS